jgi:5,5'-dehydrodivanillate O-demethylase
VHTEWLHGKLYEFLNEESGAKVAISKHHVKIAFDEFPFGIIKRRLLEGQKEDADDWVTGHPLVFPNTLAGGSGGGLWTQKIFQIRVPVDDTHTRHFWYHAYVPPADTPVPQHLLDRVPVYEPPVKDDRGNFLMNYIHAQDIMAWTTQGPIADRTREKLGASDMGVVMYRRMLFREMEKVARGEDPIGILRGKAPDVIDLPRERGKDMYSDGFVSQLRRQMSNFSPIADDLVEVFTKDRSRRDAARSSVPAA